MKYPDHIWIKKGGKPDCAFSDLLCEAAGSKTVNKRIRAALRNAEYPIRIKSEDSEVVNLLDRESFEHWKEIGQPDPASYLEEE
tara:strand:+ start:605 stop:856 length:252 start_codon:yes stop_codon:yes gene_type:complete